MYVVTFYSFKGGVGRTLALANVGVQLARTGRRVLLVDFDLEAPGLHTFKLLKPKESTPGLVDYITDYANSLSSPDVRSYIYEAFDVGQQDGRLWVMPSGQNDPEYARKLAGINWQHLYDKQHGYLMFEDMKAQWEKVYQPDYVLIDSRTGHTDIGGICTRQLPDAVVVLFFPNEQNLNGLKPIVSAIRAEDKKTEKTTRMHFVMSNVPDLDDEEEIIADMGKRFHEDLGYKELTSVIYRYDSLSLLQQSIFVAERPKSRLAKEYNKLMQEVTEYNLEDRQGVIQSIKKLRLRYIENQINYQEEEQRIDKIIKYHPKDGELLYLLARELVKFDERLSRKLLTRSLECGYRSPEAILLKADNLRDDGKGQESVQLVWEALDYPDIGLKNVLSGLNIIRRFASKDLIRIAQTQSIRTLSMDEAFTLSTQLQLSKQELQVAVDVLRPYCDDPDIKQSSLVDIKGALMLPLIGLSKFEDVLGLFGDMRFTLEKQDITSCFNYAMAEWAYSKKIPTDIFSHVAKLGSVRKRPESANYMQCLAVSFWAIGSNAEALKCLDSALSIISDESDEEFSCWRYLIATTDEFQEDCHQIKRLIEGEDVKPLFWNQ